MSDPITLRISGKAMSTIEGSELSSRPEMYTSDERLLPAVREATAALQAAEGRRAGKGWSYRVTVSPEAAAVILDYCATVGETFAGESEPETRADGRALLQVVHKAGWFYAARNHEDSERYGEELYGVRQHGARGWCAVTFGIHTGHGSTREQAEADAARLNEVHRSYR